MVKSCFLAYAQTSELDVVRQAIDWYIERIRKQQILLFYAGLLTETEAELDHCDISIANSAEEGIVFLRNNSYELVFLDHDFEGFKLTGSHLAQTWAKEKALFKTHKPKIIIHSMNIEKAAVMENFLKTVSSQVTRLPFKFINMNNLILEKIFE